MVPDFLIFGKIKIFYTLFQLTITYMNDSIKDKQS